MKQEFEISKERGKITVQVPLEMTERLVDVSCAIVEWHVYQEIDKEGKPNEDGPGFGMGLALLINEETYKLFQQGKTPPALMTAKLLQDCENMRNIAISLGIASLLGGEGKELT